VPPGAPWPPGPATYQRTNGLAVASMVLGIVSFFCLGVLLVPPLLAVIFGHVAMDQIARSGGTQKGRGLAITGLVLGWILLVPLAILAFIWLGYGISNL
jgi:Domain of unknown function (DUF4190)